MAAKARVLAIDDQLYFRSFIEGLLSEEGYAVTTASSEAEAVEILERDGPFDLAIVDLIMPDTDGIETVSRLHQRWPEQDVIVVTGVGEVRSVVAAMKRGASDYLLKPIDRSSLLESLGQILDRRRLQGDHDRLLEENVQVMGRLSHVEAALDLWAIDEPSGVAEALVGLCCAHTGAASGEIWAAGEDGDEPRRLTDPATGCAGDFDWPPARSEIGRALLEGRPHAHACLGGGHEIWLGCRYRGRVRAIVRLIPGEADPRDADGAAGIAAISGLALGAALERRTLLASSFREPVSGLPSLAFLAETARTEIHKAQRFGRRLSLLCVEARGLVDSNAEVARAVVSALVRTLRNTDLLAADGEGRFWVLVTDTDPLGCVVLKRRIAECLRKVAEGTDVEAQLALGISNHPVDGESFDALREAALAGVACERNSIARELSIDAATPLASIGQRLLDRAMWMPASFVSEAAELLIGDLSCRPRDRALLFLAPGNEREAFLDPLTSLGDADTSTDVFLASDGETLPAGPAITALGVPPDVDQDSSWIVRFGEGPAYALIAGAPRQDGARPVFHSSDPVLVEHMTFRLRAETGFGMRS